MYVMNIDELYALAAPSALFHHAGQHAQQDEAHVRDVVRQHPLQI
jgi:hypothetical protein